MHITYFDDYQAMSQRACSIFMEVLHHKKNALICAATGGSPAGLYQGLAQAYTIQPTLFNHLRVLKLDEWGGIPMNDPNTCESYLVKHFLNPLHIQHDRMISFNSLASDPVAECVRVQREINKTGPIDCCMLGLGKNGHIGFNEPAAVLDGNCHVGQLSAASLAHSMTKMMTLTPEFAMTVGMKAILQSKMILFLVTGQGKQEVIKKLLEEKISTQLPASFLWLHPNVHCLIDKTSC